MAQSSTSPLGRLSSTPNTRMKQSNTSGEGKDNNWKKTLFYRNSYDNDLFFAMRGAGSSFGIATEFLYVIHRSPETEPAVILVWIDDMKDLWRVQEAAYKSNRSTQDLYLTSLPIRYSIAINNEFAGDFWNSFKTRIVYKFLPTLLTSTKILHRLVKVIQDKAKPVINIVKRILSMILLNTKNVVLW